MAKTRLEDPDRLNKPGLVHFFRSFSANSHDGMRGSVKGSLLVTS